MPSPIRLKPETADASSDLRFQAQSADAADTYAAPYPLPPYAPVSPNAPMVSGLPVAGYKPTQPKWAVDLVNVNKVLEEAVMRQLDHLKVQYPTDVDQRQVALARTKLEEAFYHANKAIFQPDGSRILEGEKSDLAAEVLQAARGQISANS